MARTYVEQSAARLELVVAGLASQAAELSLAFVYEDEASQMWAAETSERIAARTGYGRVRSTWWKLQDLYQPGVMAGAVSKAMRADIIVLATRGTEGMPLPFYFWVNAWLPHRRCGSGALIALLGATVGKSAPGRLRNYLKAVARQGRMELLVEERLD